MRLAITDRREFPAGGVVYKAPMFGCATVRQGLESADMAVFAKLVQLESLCDGDAVPRQQGRLQQVRQAFRDRGAADAQGEPAHGVDLYGFG